MTGDPPADVVALADRRAAARASRDFAAADVLRDQIAAAGWRVVDEPGGAWRLDPPGDDEDAEPSARVRPTDVTSRLDEPATEEATVHWVVEGWPDDVARAIASFRAHHGARRIRYVVADVTGVERDAFGDDVEVLPLEGGTGWGAATNAGLRRASGEIVLVMDGSIEVEGDVLGPLERALSDPQVGIVGPFGIVTHDLREFEEADRPGPCDAIEGYCMAMRRQTVADTGGVDERFRWYRTADIEWSFRVKDLGMRTEVVPLPVIRHAHRMWFETPPADRARWSKRNFYRFLDRWRDRWDLVLDPRPPA